MAENDNVVGMQFVDKSAIASMLGVSKRSVDNLMAAGMPHLRLGERRTRFSPPEVAEWVRTTYGARRRGKVTAPAAPMAAA